MRHLIVAVSLVFACGGEVPEEELLQSEAEQLLRGLEDWCCDTETCNDMGDIKCGTDHDVSTGCKPGQIKWWCPSPDDFDCKTCTKDPNY